MCSMGSTLFVSIIHSVTRVSSEIDAFHYSIEGQGDSNLNIQELEKFNARLGMIINDDVCGLLKLSLWIFFAAHYFFQLFTKKLLVFRT